MQSIDSARFSWRQEKGQDLSGDLHDAARSAPEGAATARSENDP